MMGHMETATETPWLTPAQQQVWRSFVSGTTVLNERLDRDLRSTHGLSVPEYEILVWLSESPDRSIRMAKLAAAVSHSRSRVTHTIARLEREGLVVRGQCSEDGRGVSAVLTDEGFRLLETAAHTHVRGVHSYLVENASPEEFAVLGQIMQRVLTQLGGKC